MPKVMQRVFFVMAGVVVVLFVAAVARSYVDRIIRGIDEQTDHQAAVQLDPALWPWIIATVLLVAGVAVAAVTLRRTAPLRARLDTERARVDRADPVAALTHLPFFKTKVLHTRRQALERVSAGIEPFRVVRTAAAREARDVCDGIAHGWDTAHDETLRAIEDSGRRELALKGLAGLTGDCSATDRAIAAQRILAADIEYLPAAATATLQQWVDQSPAPVWPLAANQLTGAPDPDQTPHFVTYPEKTTAAWPHRVVRWINHRPGTTLVPAEPDVESGPHPGQEDDLR